MFGKKGHRKASNPILGIFRLFISLIIMAVLGLGLLQAYKSFSGYDPTTVSPQASLKNILTSEGAYEFIVSLLSFSPTGSFDKAKDALTTDRGGSSNTPSGPVRFRFAVIADSHKDYSNLAKALKQAKDANAKIIVGMGDLSDVGTVEELKKTKEQFDLSGLPYYITPGDHDLWDPRDKNLPAAQNFMDTFGPPYQAFSYDSVRYILIYNSDNYLGLDELQLKWLEDELSKQEQNPSKLIFAIADLPIFHPSSDHVMGKTNEKLKNQADHLASIFKKHGVDEVFSADTHFFSQYKDPINDLNMTTVGAITSDRNPQTPRFVLVDIYEDGSYNIQSVEIK